MTSVRLGTIISGTAMNFVFCNAISPRQAVWCHFLRVLSLGGLWEIRGPSDVLPLPLKMHPCSPSNLPPPAICFVHRLKALKWWRSLAHNVNVCVLVCVRVLQCCAHEGTSTGVIIQNIRDQQKVGFLPSSFPCNTMQVNNGSRLSHRHYPPRFTVSFSYMSPTHFPPVTPLKR